MTPDIHAAHAPTTHAEAPAASPVQDYPKALYKPKPAEKAAPPEYDTLVVASKEEETKAKGEGYVDAAGKAAHDAEAAKKAAKG
jgi:hypothetical protein